MTDDLKQHLRTYKRMARRVPTFNMLYGSDAQLHAALRRGHTELFKTLLCRRLWLLVCHYAEPLFEAKYGNPYHYWDEDAGELRDVWLPVVENAFRKRRRLN
jgi:hypothetical protein